MLQQYTAASTQHILTALQYRQHKTNTNSIIWTVHSNRMAESIGIVQQG